MEIEMDSTPAIKKLGQLKQKAQALIGQAGRVCMNTKVNSERAWGVFKLPSAKSDAVPSASRKKSLMGMNKQSNAQGSTKSLQRFYSVESMDSDIDHIVASLNLESITNNYNMWNYLAVCKQMSSVSFSNVTYKTST